MGEMVQARAALLIPAWNEEPAIGETLRRVPGGVFERILVVDNGSSDGTASAATAGGAEVVCEPERGYGAACLKGLGYLGSEIEVVVFMQADASEDPAEAILLIGPIRRGEADLVLGSRTLGKAEKGSLEPHQRLGNHLATSLIRLIYGHAYTDLGPFRAISRNALERLEMKDRGYGWTIEMQVKALQRGLRVREVPVTSRVRVGTSKVSGNIRASLRAGFRILYTLFRLTLAK